MSIHGLIRVNTYIHILVFKTIEKGSFARKVWKTGDFTGKNTTLRAEPRRIKFIGSSALKKEKKRCGLIL